MKIVSLAEVKAKLSAYVKEVEKSGPVVITRNGKAVAVIVAPVDDDDLESLVLSRSPRFRALLARSRRSIKSGKWLSHEDFWKSIRESPGAGRERQ
jgi:prevent-host-death family protein